VRAEGSDPGEEGAQCGKRLAVRSRAAAVREDRGAVVREVGAGELVELREAERLAGGGQVAPVGAPGVRRVDGRGQVQVDRRRPRRAAALATSPATSRPTSATSGAFC
jgi:hypothetical protein